MKEIRIHGRGGQGAVTAAELLAVAAFKDGWFTQAFPSFGVERRGAPVAAFVRIDEVPIRLRSQIYKPDYVIVLDDTLVDTVDVASGIKPYGFIFINSIRSPTSFNIKAKIITINATQIALNVIGKPIVNTTIVGAFAGICHDLDLSSNSITKAIKEIFPEKLADINIEAARIAYERMKA